MKLMTPDELTKEFIKGSYSKNIKGNLNKINEAYDYFMENLPNNNENAAILHQLLDVIEMLEILCIKEFYTSKSYASDMHEFF